MPSFKWVNDGSLMSVYYDGQDGKRNPALEFVNAICKVFQLDSTMEEEVLFICLISDGSEKITFLDMAVSC